MEIEDIKKLPPEIILEDLKIPYKVSGNRIMALATWRGERTPSVSIQMKDGIWLWKDFGENSKIQGGTWIDLYMVVHCISFKEAVQLIRKNLKNKIKVKEYSKENIIKKKWQLYTIKSKKLKRNEEIIKYLKEKRKIIDLPSWIYEINYEIINTETGEIINNIGFGIKDLNGNWHTRKLDGKYFVLKFKEENRSTISIIKAKEKDRAIITEGLTDALALYQIPNLQDKVIIVLNSVSNTEEVYKHLNKFTDIFLCTDNDEAGKISKKNIYRYIKDNLKNKNIYNIKFESKDINDALIKNEKIKIQKIS